MTATFLWLRVILNMVRWTSVLGQTNLFNAFHTTGHFLYLLKTSENNRLFDIFRGYRKRPVAWNLRQTQGSFSLRWSGKGNRFKHNLNVGSFDINPFQSSVAFHIETSYLFCSSKKIDGFYMKRNTMLK